MKIPVKIEKVTTVTVRHKAKITGAMLREALGLPESAKIRFHVPGGGDWSNCTFDINKENPIVIDWEEEKETTREEEL